MPLRRWSLLWIGIWAIGWGGVLCGLCGLPSTAQSTARSASSSLPADPLQSVQWSTVAPAILGQSPLKIEFDPRLEVYSPQRVEDPAHVPVSVRIPPPLQNYQKLVLFADYNPIPGIFSLRPTASGWTVSALELSFKVQEATPLRAAVLLPDGVWHVSGLWLDAAGGGCTTASASQASRDWESHLNAVAARRWSQPTGERLRFSLVHPMDTGLANGIPAFYLNEIVIALRSGTPLVELSPAQPVSENPLLTVDLVPSLLPKGSHQGSHRDAAELAGQDLILRGRDSDGNTFAVRLPPSSTEEKHP